MRGRGLKPCIGCEFELVDKVAPHAGAWIETPGDLFGQTRQNVAPHAGAWIETLFLPARSGPYSVAPHAGAWIETARRLDATSR